MTRPFLSEPKTHVSGLTKYQADAAYINNEEHATFTDNIDMSNHKITNLSNGTDDKDSANIGQVRQLLSRIKIEYKHKYGIVSDTTPYGHFGGSEGYHVATDVFYYGFVVQCRICVPETPDSNIFVWRDLDEVARRSAGYVFKVTIIPDATDLSNSEPNEISRNMISYKFILSYIFNRQGPGHSLNDNPNLNRYWISYVCYVLS